MSLKYSNLKLALVLALSLVGPAACNTQKAEQVEEEESAEAQADTSANRDNRSSQSGDAAFIKIFPDGEVIPNRGESATVTVPTAAPAPAATPAPEGVTPTAATPAAEPTETPTQTTGSTEETPAPTPAPEEPTASTETGSQPAPESTPEPIVVVSEPAPAPTPVASEESALGKDPDDASRPVLTLNEATASTIISVLPKENKSIVAIGKHSDFIPGPYMILAKWTNDSKKVKVNVTSIEAKEKNCAIDDYASQGEWKTLGVFYLTKNAKVVITNGKNSSFAVKNELQLKPVIADHLNSPSKFKCLDGQIDGQGLIAFP